MIETSTIVSIVVPLIIGFLVGVILRTIIKLIAAIIILLALLVGFGFVSIDVLKEKVIGALMGMGYDINDATGIVSALASTLPIGIWFFVGLIIGFFIKK